MELLELYFARRKKLEKIVPPLIFGQIRNLSIIGKIQL